MSSVLAAGAVALAYASGVVGLHRLNVHRLRKQAGFYPTLAWLDWDTLLSDVFQFDPKATPITLPQPPEGGPAPRCLTRAPSSALAARHELLCSLVKGAPVDPALIESVGFSGGEARWLGLLTELRESPRVLLGRFEQTPPASVPEVMLHEWLLLTHDATPVNLELAVFSSKRRISAALGRFAEHPALFFVRAKASSLLGFNASVLDDLARAVYFSRQAPFYLAAVLESPFVEDARPALWQACRTAATPALNVPVD